MVTQKKEVGAANGMAMNVLQQINAVKSFNLEPLLSGKYFKQLKKIQISEENISYRRAGLSFVQGFGSVLIYITLMVVGSILIMKEELTAGNFVVILMLVEPFGAFVYQIQYFLYALKDCKTGSARVMDILSLPEEDSGQKEPVSGGASGQDDFIRFSDVSFSYH